ncbi:hypothetical protein ACEPPN_000685 [Leptodophora sp. 'Broadleaf-Isolate-01']
MATLLADEHQPSTTEVGNIYTDDNELKSDLKTCLSSLQNDGSFSVFETVENPPNPGIYLESGGLVGLPLNDHDAELIVTASHAAPFGKGEATIVDTNVRKTWELSPSKFQLKNPAWSGFIDTVVAKVSAGLGVDATSRCVRAELYKMLLYDEGAMFKPHQDSEKTPGMFATLVVALPSKHEGGEVRVSHNGETKVYATSTTSEFDGSYLAWFSDVIHEVKPVTSGRRLVLTYNLIHSTLGSTIAGASNLGTAQLKSILGNWKTSLEKGARISTMLAYMLDHQYTESSMSFDGLKGHDRNIGAHLRATSAESGFFVYLASIEMTVEGGCDEDSWGGSREDGFHDIVEEIDRTTVLKRVVDVDGAEVAEELAFNEDLFSFVQEEPFKNLSPDDEDYSGYTGNEGVSATHFYRRTVAILVEISQRMEFLLPDTTTNPSRGWDREPICKNQTDVLKWLEYFSPKQSEPDNTEAKEGVSQICDLVSGRMRVYRSRPPAKHWWEREMSPPFGKDVLAQCLKVAFEAGNMDALLKILDVCPNDLPPSAFSYVGRAMLRYTLDSNIPKLTTYLQNVTRVADRLEIIDAFRTGMNEEATQSQAELSAAFESWMQSTLDQTLSSDTFIMSSARDGAVLANLATVFSSQDTFNKILPAVKRNTNHTVMAITFVTGLIQHTAQGEVAENVAESIFRDVVSDVVEDFSLESLGPTLTTIPKAESSYTPVLRRPEPVAVIDVENSNNIAAFICSCLKFKMDAELNQAVSKMILEMQKVGLEFFDALYLPMLKTLITSLSERSVPMQDPIVSKLFQNTLSTYITRYVRSEPSPAKDFKRRAVSCSCQDCRSLNAFLIDPRQKVGRFAVAKKRRGHLHSMLAGIDCTHDTERRGSPQTLVVTKTDTHYKAERKAWVDRCVVIRKHFSDMGAENLKVVLADEYNSINELKVNVAGSLPAAGSSEAQAGTLTSSRNANRVLSPVSRRKVPEVIVIED